MKKIPATWVAMIALPSLVLLSLAPGDSFVNPQISGDRKQAMRIPDSCGQWCLNPHAYRAAAHGLQYLVSKGVVQNDSILTLIDYSLPSTSERLFVIHLGRQLLLARSLVAHGRNSGENNAERFSNRLRSYQSSLGFFITGDTYQGSHGYSLRLHGVDKGFNDQANSRAIVMHAADYVSDEYIHAYGRIGRSLGCPALPPEHHREIIDMIKKGTVLFSYYPDSTYLKNSTILTSCTTGAFDYCNSLSVDFNATASNP